MKRSLFAGRKSFGAGQTVRSRYVLGYVTMGIDVIFSGSTHAVPCR